MALAAALAAEIRLASGTAMNPLALTVRPQKIAFVVATEITILTVRLQKIALVVAQPQKFLGHTLRPRNFGVCSQRGRRKLHWS